MFHFTGIKKSLYDYQNISSLYWKGFTLTSQLSLDGTDVTVEPTALNTERGIRQGCILSQHLFNLYTDSVIRDVEI